MPRLHPKTPQLRILNEFTTNFHKPENWIHTHRIAVYWWQRALEDPWFANQLHCRWDGVYATVMSLESMNEMSYLRDWIGDRLNWINDRWGGMCLVASDQATQLISDPRLKVFPNPSDLSHTYISLSHSSASELSVRLYDLSGKRVYQSEVFYSGSEYAFPLPDLSFLPPGMYTLEVTDGQSMREITKLLKQ